MEFIAIGYFEFNAKRHAIFGWYVPCYSYPVE